MAYTDFTLERLQDELGIANRIKPLFDALPPIEPSEWLQHSLRIAEKLPLRSEKSKSEAIVYPILTELRERNNDFFTIHSGDTLNGDEAIGLKGECDFILAKEVGTFTIGYPIIQVVEAKRNDIDGGVAQCAAQMVGAQRYQQRKNLPAPTVYGCVTIGTEWLFMQIDENTVYIDNKKYFINELPQILAIFQAIIDKFD